MSDHIIRAAAADAQILAFAATTKDTVETARQLHNTSPVVTAALGRLLTAGALMGSMLKGEKDLLTLQVRGSGPMQGMTVTADAHANVKGYANVPQVLLPANAKGKLDVAGAIGSGFLRVVKDLGLKEPYTGQTALVTGEIAEDLTYYFAVSEQTPSCVGLGVLMEKDNTVKQAGGFLIQLLPYAGEDVIARLEENLSLVTSVTALLDAGCGPKELLGILLGNLGVKVIDTVPTRFFCGCTRERVARAVIGIGKKDLQELIDEGKPVEANCHFCNRTYQFGTGELMEIYRQAGR